MQKTVSWLSNVILISKSTLLLLSTQRDVAAARFYILIGKVIVAGAARN